MPSAVDFKEGDRVQYKIDLGSEKVSEGTIQKVLKGGESLREEGSSGTSAGHQFIPRYIIEDEGKHTYETFTSDHLIKKL